MSCCFTDSGGVVQTASELADARTPRDEEADVEDLVASETTPKGLQPTIESLVAMQIRTVMSAHEQDLTALKAEHDSLQERLQACEKSVSDVVDSQRQLESRFRDVEKHHVSFELPQEEDAGENSNKIADMSDVASSAQIDCAAEIVLRHSNVYEFKASTWDMMVFFGQGVLNVADSVVMAICTALTLAVQFVFCLIVARSMNAYPLTEDNIAEIELWRYFTGHHVAHYDPVTNSSLVARTCAGSLSLNSAATQNTYFDSISGFLADDSASTPSWLVDALDELKFVKELDGQVLSSMCFLLWTLSCLQELVMICEYIIGVFALRGRVTELHRHNDELKLNQVSRFRCGLVFIFNTLPRLFLLVSLFWYGFHFLVYTIELNDLILNALALTFITEIDDVIFEVFATTSAKVMQQQMRPMHLHVSTRESWMHKYVDVKSMSLMMVVFIWFMFIWFNELETLKEKMREVHARLCGNQRDFVAVEHPATKVWYFYNTASYNAKSAEDVKHTLSSQYLYFYEAMKRLTDYDKKGLWDNRLLYSVQETSVNILQQHESIGYQAAANEMTCVDLLDVQSNTTRIAWATSLNYQVRQVRSVANESFIKCQEWQAFCHNYTEVRAMCPDTCGCADIYAGIYDLHGCTSLCESIRATRIASFVKGQWVPASRTCPDINATYNSTYQEFYHGYSTYIRSLGTLTVVLSTLGLNSTYGLAESAWDNGCNLTQDIVDAQIIPNPCQTTALFASAVAWCPTSCAYTCIDNSAAMMAASGGQMTTKPPPSVPTPPLMTTSLSVSTAPSPTAASPTSLSTQAPSTAASPTSLSTQAPSNSLSTPISQTSLSQPTLSTSTSAPR